VLLLLVECIQLDMLINVVLL